MNGRTSPPDSVCVQTSSLGPQELRHRALNSIRNFRTTDTVEQLEFAAHSAMRQPAFVIVDLLLCEFKQGRLQLPVRVWIRALNAIYGAVHISVWNSVFPTALEGGLWRISAMCIIMALPAIFLLRARALSPKFISLRHMPYGVYSLPDWLSTIPRH